MSGDPILNRAAGEARRSRRVPPGAVCGACGGDEHLVAKASGSVRCYQHRDPREWLGDPRYEVDHVAGRRNLGGLTVALEANAHRDVTEIRSVMGQDDWPLAGGNPLLAAAHALGGVASLLWSIAKWLVRLCGWLGETVGEDWYQAAPAGPLRA